MTRKNEPGAFSVKGRAAVESREIVSAIREGRLTRRQFDAWHTKRRSEGRGFVITLLDKASASAPPAKRAARKHKAKVKNR